MEVATLREEVARLTAETRGITEVTLDPPFSPEFIVYLNVWCSQASVTIAYNTMLIRKLCSLHRAPPKSHNWPRTLDLDQLVAEARDFKTCAKAIGQAHEIARIHAGTSQLREAALNIAEPPEGRAHRLHALKISAP